MDIGSLTGRIELEDQMSTVLKKADEALTKFGENAESQASKVDSSMAKAGKAFTTLSIPIAAFGAAALAAGYTVEGAYNTIARKTGETGEALQGLKKDFETVFGQVPQSAQEVAVALSDVHQRLGLTGAELQTVTKKFLDFANANQIDAAQATRTVSTLMGALSESTKLTAEEIGNASGIMDKLTYAAQISGASVTQLADGVIKGGLAFVEMGFSLDESLALFAQFEKVGANVTDVTSSLHRTMGHLAKEGVTDLAGAFKQLLEQIKNAPTYADASRLSIEAFGMKAGPKLTEEIRSGTYSIEELANSIKHIGNVTETTQKNSESFTETLGQLRNQATLALAPIGIEMIKAFRDLMPAIVDVVKVGADVLKLFAALPEPVQKTAFAIGAITVAAGPAIMAFGKIQSAVMLLGGYMPTLSAAIIGATTALTPFLAMVGTGVVVIGSLTAVVTAGYQAWKLWQESRQRAHDADVQAEIDASNLVRVNQSLGTSFKTMDEATKWLQENRVPKALKAQAESGQQTAQTVDLLADRLKKLKSDAMTPIDAATKASIKQLDALGATLEEISGVYKDIPQVAIKHYLEGMKESEKATKKNAETLDDLNALMKATSWEAMTKMMEKAAEKTKTATERINAAIMSNATIQTNVQKELSDMVFKEYTDRYTFMKYEIDQWAEHEKLKLDYTVDNWLTASADIDALARRKKRALEIESDVDSADDIWNNPTKHLVPEWRNSIAAIGDAFGDMFEGVNNKVAQVFKVAGDGMSFILTKAQNFNEKLSAGLAMAASIVQTLAGDSKAGGIAAGALSGAAVGASFGGFVGAGIGAAAGGIMGWIAANKKAKEEAKEHSKTLEELKKNIDSTYGSVENYSEAFERLGVAFSYTDNMSKNQLETFKKQQDEFQRRSKLVTEATSKMTTGLTAAVEAIAGPWKKLGDDAEEATGKAMEAYDKYQKALADPKAGNADKLKESYEEAFQASLALNMQLGAESQNAKQKLEDLGTQAIATFSAAYLATGSFNEAIVAVAPSVNVLSDAYKALGIESDNALLKSLMIQSSVIESSPELVAAIDGQADALQGMAQMGLLNADTFAAMQRTGLELYTRLQGETANAAIEAGDLGDQTRNALVPMQGFLHEASVQAKLLGIPLDENTQRLIDQSEALGIWKDAGATAQDKLIEGMSAIVEKLDLLLTRLGAVSDSLTNLPDAHATVTVDHIDRYYNQKYDGEETEYKASGGMIPRGTDTVPTMLTPGEGIVNTRGMSQLGAEGLNALNRGAGIGNDDALLREIRDMRLADEQRAQFDRENLALLLRDEIQKVVNR